MRQVFSLAQSALKMLEDCINWRIDKNHSIQFTADELEQRPDVIHHWLPQFKMSGLKRKRHSELVYHYQKLLMME